MSTTSTKRPHSEAALDATAFSDLFVGLFDRWTVAGSTRRGEDVVGDVEHVVIPKMIAGAAADLFGGTAPPVNAVFKKLDELVATAPDLMSKHVYRYDSHGAPSYRWGAIARGVDFRGHLHELFCATADNFGPTLAIRTGPAEFSKSLVTGLLRHGRRNKDGKVWKCEPCQLCDVPPDSGKRDWLCQRCDGTRLIPVEAIPCADERHYFELCGVAWVEPRDRR